MFINNFSWTYYKHAWIIKISQRIIQAVENTFRRKFIKRVQINSRRIRNDIANTTYPCDNNFIWNYPLTLHHGQNTQINVKSQFQIEFFTKYGKNLVCKPIETWFGCALYIFHVLIIPTISFISVELLHINEFHFAFPYARQRLWMPTDIYNMAATHVCI